MEGKPFCFFLKRGEILKNIETFLLTFSYYQITVIVYTAYDGKAAQVFVNYRPTAGPSHSSYEEGPQGYQNPPSIGGTDRRADAYGRYE